MGATGFAYEVASKFGLSVVEPRPALVPLTLGNDEALFKSLSGVSTDVIASCGDIQFREAALFTHRGMSGPAILQISSYWRPGLEVRINFVPPRGTAGLVDAKRTHPRSALRSVLANALPARLADVLAERIGLSGELANHPDRILEGVQQRLSDWRFLPTGTEGFAKAEVTAGGISTDELSSQTMQSKRVRGLYAIGEAVDVTGWLGGYNFQWAWASGWAAGQAF
jgi:predicted Rossmann fold flavoprotein